MLELSDRELLAWLAAWLWPFLRISAFVLTVPAIGTRSVPARVRLVFALGLTVVLAPLVGPAVLPATELLSAQGLLVGAQQVMIGAGLGLVLRMVFLVLEFAGQVVAQQMGLGFAAMVDPASGSQVPVISQFYVILATLSFFALDAHLQLVTLLADSFELLPVGGGGFAPGALAGIIAWSGDLLGIGVVVMLPIVAALLVVNLAFGVMARAAPQLNIFAVGFPVMIVFGTLTMVLTLGALPAQVEGLFASGFEAAYRLLQGR
ncbi:MAG: flagellar biosynthetic protein FliR [Gammaproteobacteria bacterium]